MVSIQFFIHSIFAILFHCFLPNRRQAHVILLAACEDWLGNIISIGWDQFVFFGCQTTDTEFVPVQGCTKPIFQQYFGLNSFVLGRIRQSFKIKEINDSRTSSVIYNGKGVCLSPEIHAFAAPTGEKSLLQSWESRAQRRMAFNDLVCPILGEEKPVTKQFLERQNIEFRGWGDISAC